jgi:hypothetical protein
MMSMIASILEFAAYAVKLSAAGKRIGSGGIEKGFEVVVNRRLQGRRNMRWRRERIEAMVALRVALLNRDWDRLHPPTLIPQQLPVF